jgi:tryptophan-rich sensory protein
MAYVSHSAPRGHVAPQKHPWAVFALCVGVCFVVALLGSIFTGDPSRGWYTTLEKPEFTPPSWLFAPVWSLLYLAMGVAAFLAWKAAGWTKGHALFAVQLGLNLLWSYLFFARQSPAAALVDIVALWGAIVATMVAFFCVSRAAGFLLAPYLAWVSFAAVLNASIVMMN